MTISLLVRDRGGSRVVAVEATGKLAVLDADGRGHHWVSPSALRAGDSVAGIGYILGVCSGVPDDVADCERAAAADADADAAALADEVSRGPWPR